MTDWFTIIAISVTAVVIIGFIAFMIHVHYIMPIEQRCEKRSTLLNNEIVTYSQKCAEYYVSEKGFKLKELKPQWGDDAYVLERVTK